MLKQLRMGERLRRRLGYALAAVVGIVLAETEMFSPVRWVAEWLTIPRAAAAFLILVAFGVACFLAWLRCSVGRGSGLGSPDRPEEANYRV